MSLEDRLIEALHREDDFDPSPDLFARLSRSIEEDRRYRRRILAWAAALVIWLCAMAYFMASVTVRLPMGSPAWPMWSLQVLILAVLVPVFLTLTPAIRRYGAPLVEDVFHADPAAGARFSGVLDIAYYAGFGGVLLLSLDLTTPGTLVTIGSEAVRDTAARIALFLGILGIAHTLNLLALPVIGLLHSSSVARRRGASRPGRSAQARQAERVATAIVMVVTATIIVGGLALIVLGITGFV